MSYSDRDLMIATQIAYYDIPKKYEGLTLREIFEKDSSIYKKLQNNLNSAGSELERSRAEKALNLYKEIKNPNSQYGDWVIKNVNNDNANSGFYGCLIETEKNSAIVGFRGSESFNGDQFQKDWIEADFGLLNSNATRQQDKATEYMNYINNKYWYDNYATSGHSLGGNLSAHAGLTAPPEMQSKISQCYSMDGPGFSDEYIAAHQEEINRFGNKITHYQWSVVGALLHPVPGENFRTIRTNDEVYGESDLTSCTQKHDTGFVIYDEDGNVIDGEQDSLSRAIGQLSKKIDNADMGTGLVNIVAAYMTLPEDEKKAIGYGGIAVVGAWAITHPVATGAIALTAITIFVIGKIDPAFYTEVLVPFIAGIAGFVSDVVDTVKTTIENVIRVAMNVADFAKGLVDKLIDGVKSVINGFAEWLYKQSAGYKYANANPYVVINTTKMTNYASQLSALSGRAKRLDSKMNSLYWHLGIDWNTISNLGKLLKAEFILDYSRRLDKCVNYLNLTASDFDNVERDISNM